MGKKKVALFIDAENISADYAESIFNYASAHGKILVKKIYADWTNDGVKPWKEAIGEYSIKAIQCFHFTNTKNSSDMSLTTDVLEVLYEKDIQIFIIVSSDSDYLPLAQKLKEKGKKALGFGTQNAIKPYVNSFNKFIYLEQKQKQDEPKKQDESPEQKLLRNLRDIIDKLIKAEGKATYSKISTNIRTIYPDFNPKNYGYSNFRKFISDKFLSQNQEYKESSSQQRNFCLIKKNAK